MSNSSEIRQYGIVELPCFVNSAETGLNMLGGLEKVKKVLLADSSNASSIKLNFSVGDPLRKGISSEKVLCPGIVVRLKRKRIDRTDKESDDTHDDDSSKMTYEVLGLTKQIIHFRSPADFQV